MACLGPLTASAGRQRYIFLFFIFSFILFLMFFPKPTQFTSILSICIIIPLFVGTLSAFLTHDAMTTFETIQKPVLSPPGWLFPIVWTVLYILMGIASYLVLTTESSQHVTLFIYKIQLFFNFIWPIIFFNLRLYLLAFIWLIILWLLILITAILFYKTNKLAGYLMLPYLIWVTFAGYLNLSIYLLN